MKFLTFFIASWCRIPDGETILFILSSNFYNTFNVPLELYYMFEHIKWSQKHLQLGTSFIFILYMKVQRH